MSSTLKIDTALREFHVSRAVRDRYQFEKRLFGLSGNVIFANFHAARVFAQKINDKRDVVNFPEQAVRAGQINAMGLIDEILHYVTGLYRQRENPEVMKDALEHLEEAIGPEKVEQALRTFVDTFPPVAVYQGEMTPEEYLAGESDGTSHRHVALEEMLTLWLANVNPAFSPFMELFDDEVLEHNTAYPQMISELGDYFEDQPRFGPDNQTLVEMLRSPAIESPHSLQGQLDFIRRRWGSLLGEYLYRLLSSIDFLAEEEKMFFGFGPGPARVYEFGGMEAEIENFSPDSDWMPSVVILAKNTYVWLDQLSKEYDREITRLDQVPEAELDKLARWGFTGLWLIGLWERSDASKRIKQMMGNPEAVASAYSLKGYRIAHDLGGEEAFDTLKARAWKRGIRMASDMVPNHVGIDADWVIHQPDWFVQLDYPPFPSYSYTGPDLCDDDRVGIYIEDHYYDRTDAAVAFKRVDHWSGDTRYIYHGNDGTSMPWNDTAQLNYLLPEVREAVIQTILDVARRSPIIRFDAAMTLAKKHYQRLWFPEPGAGGDIPSRADFGMTKEEFDEAFPVEFWREVVDRVAEEVPDTLLLAEAFWLMEGYFVRTLGMHRVYNSAFMNMMRDEKNDEYRQLIKNTLEFDPQILKRYVNFMNNPDERTAVDQFGKGDKYFGICSVMATMPGLPMFGHGQVEGYAEKYGMEFRRAYWDETPDPWLVERHEREIFPLLHKRRLFAEVDNFYLYDFFTPSGAVDENVFAYSNSTGGERSLVIYHNRYAETRGHIRTSAAFAVKDDDGEKHLEQRTLADGLRIPNDPNAYLIFRDAVDGQEYIRNAKRLCEEGFYSELHAYHVHVFIDFRVAHDNEWRHYAQLTDYLDGRGVPNIDEALKELFLAPVHQPFRMLVSAPAFRWLMDEYAAAPGETPGEQVLAQVEHKMLDLLHAIEDVVEPTGDPEAIAAEVRDKLEIVLSLPGQLAKMKDEGGAPYEKAMDYVLSPLASEAESDPAPDEALSGGRTWGAIFGLLFTHALGKMVEEKDYAQVSRSWIDEWLLGKILANAMQEMGLPENEAWRSVAVCKMLLSYRDWLAEEAEASEKKEEEAQEEASDEEAKASKAKPSSRAYRMLHAALRQREVQAYLGVNRHRGVLWFNQEAFEQWLWWLMFFGALERVMDYDQTEAFAEAFTTLYARIERLLEAMDASDYQVGKLLDAARDS